MVDFQSRDTRQNTEDDGSDDEPAEEVAEDGDPSASNDDTLGVAVVTVGAADPASGIESESGDPATAAVVETIERRDWSIVVREQVQSTHDEVQGTVDRLLGRGTVSAIVTVGGVGIGPHDVTVGAVESLFERSIPGFGELFRVQYFEQAGPGVIGTCPTAGVSDGVPVCCLPGDPEPARFTAEELLVETLDGLVAEASGQ